MKESTKKLKINPYGFRYSNNIRPIPTATLAYRGWTPPRPSRGQTTTDRLPISPPVAALAKYSGIFFTHSNIGFLLAGWTRAGPPW